MRKKLLTALLAGALLLTTSASAEIKPYDGKGEYIMSDFESIEIAKQRARARAEQDARDQAGVYLVGYSRQKNFRLTADEITTITNNITGVVGEVNYRQEIFEAGGLAGVKYIARLTVNIDTDGITRWLEKNERERQTLLEQDEELERAARENDSRIEELNRQYASASSESARKKLKAEIETLDNNFMAIRKLNEGNRLRY